MFDPHDVYHGDVDHSDVSDVEYGDVGYGDVEYGDVDHSDVDHSDVDHGDVDHSDVDHCDVPGSDSMQAACGHPRSTVLSPAAGIMIAWLLVRSAKIKLHHVVLKKFTAVVE